MQFDPLSLCIRSHKTILLWNTVPMEATEKLSDWNLLNREASVEPSDDLSTTTACCSDNGNKAYIAAQIRLSFTKVYHYLRIHMGLAYSVIKRLVYKLKLYHCEQQCHSKILLFDSSTVLLAFRSSTNFKLGRQMLRRCTLGEHWWWMSHNSLLGQHRSIRWRTKSPWWLRQWILIKQVDFRLKLY